MATNLVGEILGNVLGNSRRTQQNPFAAGGSPFSGRGTLVAMLLPMAMQWVQRNGGVGAVLQKFRQKGYTQQATSWVSTGPNESLEPQAIDDVVGADELSRLSQQLGMGREEVAGGFAEILPEMVNQLTPDGSLPPDADDVLNNGTTTLEQYLNHARVR